MTAGYRTADVEVTGGRLRVGIWGADGSPVVLAVHGITANHLSWALVAEALPEVRLVAPDLRGRGRSGELPGPWGMAAHADDLAAVVTLLAGGPVLVVGHSMGAFVAVATAERHPGLVGEVLLVDGGLPLTAPVDLGPARQRLAMTFETVEAHRDFWRQHPALRDAWSPAITNYVDYDLVGVAPRLRSSVSVDAVAADSAELSGGGRTGLNRRLSLLTVPRGLVDEPPGLYPEEVTQAWQVQLPQLEATRLPDLNHYTVVMSSIGAAEVAAKVRELLARSSPVSRSDTPGTAHRV